MTKEFVPEEIALALREIGFDEPCMAIYYSKDKSFSWHHHKDHTNDEPVLDSGEFNISVPLYQQAFRWFREKYNLRGFIGFRPNVKQFDCHVYDMSLSGKEYVKQRTTEEYNKDPKVGTYEEAELECLKQLIKIIKEKK